MREELKPRAWVYELANHRRADGTYTDWSNPVVSLSEPCVPEGAIRNLTPLYTRSNPPQEERSDPLDMAAGDDNHKALVDRKALKVGDKLWVAVEVFEIDGAGDAWMRRPSAKFHPMRLLPNDAFQSRQEEK